MRSLSRTVPMTPRPLTLPDFLWRAILLPATFLFCLSLTAWAQDQATIVGTVTDASGGVVPDAKVTVSNPSKGFTRELVANSAGEYTAAKVPIGDYVVTVQAKGFQKLVRSGIALSVGQILRVDLQLTLGQVTQEITVAGSATRVETETSAISDVVTSTQIDNLNLNGRNFLALTTLVPGAVPDNGFDPTHLGHLSSTADVSFNGNRMEYSNLEIDGGNNSDEGSGANGGDTTPALDSIAEFRISTSNYGADIGQHAGAIIEVATKSGTKEFHGTASEFVRNDRFDANDWFVNQQIAPPGGNAPKRPLKWNTYGYTLGGPFYIPNHYNTDKTNTFFFWSQSWAKYREGAVISAGVPSQRMRGGDFSECDPTSNLFNPVISGCVLPTVNGVTVDTVTPDPNATALLDGLVPLPNNGVVGYVKAPSEPQNWREEQLRVDHNIGDKTSLFIRYTQDTWNENVVPTLWSWANYDTVQTPFLVPAKSIVMHITHSFKPNLMNEFVMAYADDPHQWYDQVGPSSVAHSINKPATWTASNFFPANKSNPLLPAIVICGGTPFCLGEDAAGLPWVNTNPIITWKDNLAYTAGKHTLKFGFFLEKYRKNEQFGYETQGSMYFDNWAGNTTNNALADMFLGRIQQYTEGTQNFSGVAVGGYGHGHWRMTSFQPYFQDDWKITRKLTLNIGARYYLFVPVHDVSRPQTFDSDFVSALYNPANEAHLDPNGNFLPNSGHNFTTFGNGLVECGTGAMVSGCRVPSYWTLSPRLGFAYDPTGAGKTAIRGGYGVYYEMGNGNESNTEGAEGNPPTTLAPSAFNVNGYQGIVPGAFGPAGIVAIPLREKWGSVQQFNLGVQHEFAGNNLLAVSYVGSLGRHLARGRNLNQIPIGVGTLNAPALMGFVGTDNLNPSNTTPMCDGLGNCDVQRILINNQQPNIFFVPYRGYGGISVKENTAISSYHSLQANFRHAFGHGLTFQTVYTWSHAIDDASSTYYQSGVDDYNLSRWKSTSGLNRTQLLVMNYTYDLPFFKNASNSVVKGGLGGWHISGITSFFTGQQVDFGCGVNGFSTGIGGSVRCNALGKLKIKKGVFNDPQFGPVPTWIDASLIGQVTQGQLRADGEPGMFGTMDRNPLTGPGRNNWDLALLKNFTLPWLRGEHSTLQFRWETFNTFNHPQWQSVSAGCDGATPFGQPCNDRTLNGTRINGGNGQVAGAWAPRIMQLGMKLTF